MRKFALATAVVVVVASSALAGDIDLQVDNFFVDRGITTAVLKITNNSSQDAEMVFASCAFLGEDERAIDVGRALVSSLPAGATAYEKARISQTQGVQFASCRIDGYN